MLASLFTISALAISAFAVPSLERAIANAPWCSGLGDGIMDTAHNFTLAAYNQTGPNTNSTGAPLVLAFTAITLDVESHTLATYNSSPYDDWPNYSLDAGGLMANGGRQTVVTAAGNSSAIFFQTSFLPFKSPTIPAQIFCAVTGNEFSGQHSFPYLAVHNRYDLFSLCKSQRGLWEVVYNVTAGASEFSVETCYPVFLNMLRDPY